jgi:hypothetical protein
MGAIVRPLRPAIRPHLRIVRTVTPAPLLLRFLLTADALTLFGALFFLEAANFLVLIVRCA